MANQLLFVVPSDKERYALPHLVRHALDPANISQLLRPRTSREDLTPQVAVRLIRSYDLEDIDRVVVLFNTGEKDHKIAIDSFRDELEEQVRPMKLDADVRVAGARWEFESWLFGDMDGLIRGTALELTPDRFQHYDEPDEIHEPRLRIKSFIYPYTKWAAEGIAKRLDPALLEQRSPSFKHFLSQVIA